MLTGMAAWRHEILERYRAMPSVTDRDAWNKRQKARRRSAIAKLSRRRNRK